MTGDPPARPAVADPWLLSILVCPATRTPLVHDSERGLLVSHAARVAYPIRDGVPVLLVEEAMPLDACFT